MYKDVGKAPGQRINNNKQPQRGERKKEFYLAGTFTFLGIHFVFSTLARKTEYH